jgi:hypothetical protein
MDDQAYVLQALFDSLEYHAVSGWDRTRSLRPDVALRQQRKSKCDKKLVRPPQLLAQMHDMLTPPCRS